MKKDESVMGRPEEEKPPILGSWTNLYYLVTGVLVVQIVLYYLITISFR